MKSVFEKRPSVFPYSADTTERFLSAQAPSSLKN